MTLIYCTRCDWQREAASPACANICSKCGVRGLRYVRYVKGVEDAAATFVMNDQRKNNPYNLRAYTGSVA